jgi:hypothetical protein
MDSRVPCCCCCSSFVLFFKIVKPFAAGAGALPALSLALSLLHASELVLVGKDKEKLSRSIQFSSNLSKCAARSGEFWRRESERESVYVCVCLCVHALLNFIFFFSSFSVGIAKAETHSGSGIAGLVKLSSLLASFLVVGTETMKWRRFLIREYHTMRVLFQCPEQFAKDGNCVERALETDTHGHVQRGRKEYRAY